MLLQFEPKTYHYLAEDLEVQEQKWYHAFISIEDLPIILAIPCMKIYTCFDAS